MKSESFSFDNGHGYSLAARFDAPDGDRYGCALFAHCFTCDKNINAVRRIATGLVRHGIAVFSFDFTGLGGSGGQFFEGHFSSQANDITAAVAYMRQTYNAVPDFLIGHSLGGTAALYAARELPDIKGVATIGSPFDPEHITHLFSEDPPDLGTEESAEVCISGRPFMVNAQFIRDFQSHPPAQWVGDVRQEVLILHSPVDTIVGIEHAENLFTALRHPKSYVSLDKADHMLTNKRDAQVAAGVIAGWAEKFFDQPQSAAAATATATAATTTATAATSDDGKVATSAQPQPAGAALPFDKPPQSDHQVVAEIGTKPFLTGLKAKQHVLVADEPLSIGGTDTAPTPFGYLLAALASCTVMTLQVYSKNKDYTLTRAVTHCDYHSKPKPHISRFIEVEGDFNDEQRQNSLRIADLCPVHKLLESGVEVMTSLSDDGKVATGAQPQPVGAALPFDKPPQSDHQVVAEIGTKPFLTGLKAKQHVLVADEPLSIGGTDTAPTPFGYLLAALASCTVMTLQVYSKNKDYTLTRAVTHCDYHSKPKPHISRFIEVEGDFNDEQRQNFLRIADLCPVHKLLESGVEVMTSFAGDE